MCIQIGFKNSYMYYMRLRVVFNHRVIPILEAGLYKEEMQESRIGRAGGDHSAE